MTRFNVNTRLIPCYVAGAYAAAAQAGIERNKQQAARWGEVALQQGFAPLVPHALVPVVTGEEQADDPSIRQMALKLGLVLLDLVHKDGTGVLWAVRNKEGRLSAGVAGEVARWRYLNVTCRDIHLVATFDWNSPFLHRNVRWTSDSDSVTPRRWRLSCRQATKVTFISRVRRCWTTR